MTDQPHGIQDDLYALANDRMDAQADRDTLEVLDEMVEELLQWKRELQANEDHRDTAEASVARAKSDGTLLDASEWSKGLLGEIEPTTRVG